MTQNMANCITKKAKETKKKDTRLHYQSDKDVTYWHKLLQVFTSFILFQCLKLHHISSVTTTSRNKRKQSISKQYTNKATIHSELHPGAQFAVIVNDDKVK